MRPTRWIATLWLLAMPAAVSAEQAPRLRGIIRDSSGGVVPHAEINIHSASGTPLAVVHSGPDGRFEWADALTSHLQLRIRLEGFALRETVAFLDAQSQPLEIFLQPAATHSYVTVSATRGAAEDAAASPHVTSIRDLTEILTRPATTLGNALEQQPGILTQQSTFAQASPFLRGLTGYHVLNLIDGIRFNNSTFRSGPNQYLAFIDPTQAQRVEALLGPTGSQYGSDSLGGTIHVITPNPRFAGTAGPVPHGDFTLGGASSDFSGFGSARLSVATGKLYWLAGVSGRRHNDLRAGRGHDSRNVFHRLFGMPLDDVRDLVGGRLQDTGFRMYGLQTKLALRPRPDQLVTFYFQRGVQDQVRGYKDLLGGLGRILSDFDPQALNWFYGRYEKLGLGVLDSLSAAFSVNSQADGSSRQNLRNTDPITADDSRVDSYGYTAQATTHRTSRFVAAFGADIYDERITSYRNVTNPLTGLVSHPRPLYPNHSSYQNLGLFTQATYDLTPTLRTSGSVRLTGVRFKTRLDPGFGIPGSSQWFRDVTFHSSLRWQTTRALSFHAVVSRGFRAPNLNDLGALGLNDLGYEIPVSEAIPAGALLSTDAGESAISKGTPAPSLSAESLMNYEFGAGFSARRLYARLQLFDAELSDPIVRRTLLFPASSVPSQLAGLPVVALPQTAAQRAQGVVSVATQLDSRAVKAFVNDGRSRYYGLESLLRFSITNRWTFDANYSYILGRDLNPNRNIRRLPPQMGSATLRYRPSGRRPWVEFSLAAAGRQDRLSGGDRDDERIGASFRRRDIADFFNGSRVAHYLVNGIFTPTGETLLQIQNRVLPGIDDNTRLPLYFSTAGWATVNVRSGLPIGERWQAMAALENLLDRNYRFHGSGIDAPGITAYLGLSYRF